MCMHIYLFVYLFVCIHTDTNTRVVAFMTALIPDSEFGELELGRGDSIWVVL